MITTITVQPRRMAHTHESHYFSLNSNSAGGPLPLLPRRTPSASSSRPSLISSTSHPATLPTLSTSSPTMTMTMTSTRESINQDSDSSSSSSSASDGTRPTIRTKRVRGVRISPLRPPELSTPIPTISTTSPTHHDPRSPTNACSLDDASVQSPTRPMLYTPGMPLRLIKDSLKSRNTSESHVSLSAENSAQGSKLATCEVIEATRIIRKKSGQLVKPSLKTSRSASRNNLSVMTFTSSSKSEPTTPTSKAVHFDAKLEHVKLFLAEQKPRAVSRDGSPTDDTSGTDSDFPAFIYGEGDDKRPKQKLVMQVMNMPARICPDPDVALEDLSLAADGTSILGRVRVRNIAFSKLVAVRFTFDSWQTTSEVTGRYLESIGNKFDRFTFTVRLNDLLARIDGKAMILAIRYSVEGREMWDNNNGQNYVATFTKVKVMEERRPTALSDDEASTDMADLHTELEKVVQSKDRTGPAFLNQSSQQTLTPSPVLADPNTMSFRTSTSFASRYDFATSLKTPWKPSNSPSLHSRTQSFPLSVSRGSSIPWPTKGPSDLSKPKSNLGSPRDINDAIFHNVRLQPIDIDDYPFPRQYDARNHQRGYFDLEVAADSSTVKRTPPGTPSPSSPTLESGPSIPRCNSFPPMGPESKSSSPRQALFKPLLDGELESELSTPSVATPSSSRSSTSSPQLFPLLGLPPDDEGPTNAESHYREFINKFCFFTGPGFATDHVVDILPRTQSASDIEELLAGLESHIEVITQSPNRSSSLDDLVLSRCGSLTPTQTITQLSVMGSHSSTPIQV